MIACGDYRVRVSLFLAKRSRPQNLPALRPSFSHPNRSSPQAPGLVKASTPAMEATRQIGDAVCFEQHMKLLFVEMGVGYDQHGQDVTAAAMRACRDAISSNSIPAFRRVLERIENAYNHIADQQPGLLIWEHVESKGSIPGVSFEQMKLQIKLGVPHSLQQSLDVDRVKSVFPYGKILNVEVVDGGLICSSGVHVEEMGDKNDDCYIVNAAVYVGY